MDPYGDIAVVGIPPPARVLSWNTSRGLARKPREETAFDVAFRFGDGSGAARRSSAVVVCRTRHLVGLMTILRYDSTDPFSAGCARNPSWLRDGSLLSFDLNAEVAEAQSRAEKDRIHL